MQKKNPDLPARTKNGVSSLHKILTDLADKRIRKNREFFNIRPEEAFRYLKLTAEMDDTAEINAHVR